VSANHHTDIATGAAASAATINAPMRQIDAKLTHAVLEYNNDSSTATTVTTSGTFYAVSGHEVSFTPAYTGQVFLVHLSLGYVYGSATGASDLNLRVVDGSNVTITDNFLRLRTDAATGAGASKALSASRAFTAAAGDVGVTRKVKLYVTHSSNGTVVTDLYAHILVVTH